MNNPRSLQFADFTALIEAFGFRFRRHNGSHRLYGRADVHELVDIQPTKNGRAKDVQVEDFLKLIDRYGLLLEENA